MTNFQVLDLTWGEQNQIVDPVEFWPGNSWNPSYVTSNPFGRWLGWLVPWVVCNNRQTQSHQDLRWRCNHFEWFWVVTHSKKTCNTLWHLITTNFASLSRHTWIVLAFIIGFPAWGKSKKWENLTWSTWWHS